MLKNLDNSLRLYNRKVLRRTKMHVYTKRYLDALYHKAFFDVPEVHLVRWTEEDIRQFKLDKNLDRFNDDFLHKKNEHEPPVKKQKVDESGKNILKLVLSREGETDTFKSQFKTVDDDKENSEKNNKKNEKKKKKKKNLDNEKNNKINNKDIENISNENISQENEKENDVDNDQENIILFDNESSNSSTEPMEIVCDEPLNDIELASTSKIGTIHCCDISKLVEPSKLEKYFECFGLSHKIPKLSKSNEKRSSMSSKNAQKTVAKKSLPLSEIESLYHKYFTKSVQDSIVIIANILNIISMSNKHHKARMDESFKKRTEAEKLKERCDANRLHVKHKKILEFKLKIYFLEVITEFAQSEFEPAFQMFFLSILTVLRILDQPKFKKGSIFKNLVLLLWNSLKNSELEHAKVFGMFRSKTFRPDCIDLISQIEDSRDHDPCVVDRMSLFFVSSVNCQEYFQPVIDAVTGDSNEDLGLLIDNAAFQCSINSKFKGSLDQPSTSTTTKKHVTINHETLASIHNVAQKEDASKRWVLAKTPNGDVLPLSASEGTSRKKIIIDPSRASQLNNFYEDFSNSLTKSITTTVVPKIIVQPKVTTLTTAPSVSNGSLQTGPTYVAFKPSIQTVKSISSSNFPRPEGSNTILVGNKQYHVIRSPVNPLRAVTTQNGFVMATVKKPEVSVRCFAKNCQSPATIMCSTCRSVKYCSHNCQRLDWYESHINNCERLNNIRQSRKDPQNTNI